MNADLKRPSDSRDRGSTLVLVLVMMVIGSLVVLPVMSYSMSVFRAQNVQIDKARSIELARGGTWVALANETALYDLCDGGALPSSLSGVSTTCQILETATLRQPSEVPYSVAVVQADTGGSVPAAIPPAMMAMLSAEQAYVNPNTRSAWDVWTTNPDHSPLSTAGKVWLPQLPVQPTSAGGTRDTDMQPGTQDPAYSSCRVFFPGTFTSAIDIAEPAYFTSGVYYFTQPITLRRGADVVVGGGGSTLGCTTDFEAISSAVSVPEPLNMSGVGGTFVFGGDARLVINDSSGTGNIRFAMNQRYVSNDEASVSASSNVSIVSVNGNHAPFVATNPADVLGADLRVDGVIAVPASTTDDPADDPDDPAGDPLAHTTGYAPSVLTPKPTAPDAPTSVARTAYRVTSGSNRGRLRVTWNAPNANGSLITGYVATASTGQTCSPPAPTLPDTSVQPSCTISGLSSGSHTATVVAKNVVGTSPPSAPSASVNIDTGSSGSPILAVPSPPTAVSVGTSYTNGLTVNFSPPVSNNGTPVTTYQVTATHTVSGAVVSCPPVWWDETSCILPVTDAPAVDDKYLIEVRATNSTGNSTPVPIDGIPTDGTTAPEPDPYLYVAGAAPAPVQVAAVAGVRTPTPIIDLTLASSAIADITILGYIVVPQGHVRINATNPANKTVQLKGGVVAANFRLDAAPATLGAVFDNPVAQKRVRLRSLATSGGYTAMSEAVVQVNRSGSLAINSWISQ